MLYDPVIGQFIMADTIVPDLYNPQSLNRYAYCLNNPVRYTDPTGHYIPEIGPGNHTTSESIDRDIVNRIESGRGFDADRDKDEFEIIEDIDNTERLYSDSLRRLENYDELGFSDKVKIWNQENSVSQALKYDAGLRIGIIFIGPPSKLITDIFGKKRFFKSPKSLLNYLKKSVRKRNKHHIATTKDAAQEAQHIKEMTEFAKNMRSSSEAENVVDVILSGAKAIKK